MAFRDNYKSFLKHFSLLVFFCIVCIVSYAMLFLPIIPHRVITVKQKSLTLKNVTILSCDYDALSKSPNSSFVEAVNITETYSSGEMGKSPNVSLPSISVSVANCSALFRGEKEEIEKAMRYQKSYPKQAISEEHYLNLSKDCDCFKTMRGYILDTMSASEASFPIAYSMLVYKDIEQVERLLRVIYRPQNSYCIHVDSKSGDTFKKALAAIARCFDNVFLASRSVDVQWGKFSVLEPDLICMEDLWKASATWKYFINLTGQEFPLKTNAELVKILKVFNGANNVQTTLRDFSMRRTMAGTPPPGIRVTTGSVHIVAQRGFVDSLLHDPISQDFLEWVKKTWIPDETFFTTLNHNPQLEIPGSYRGEPESSESNPFLVRYTVWNFQKNQTCKGKFVRMVCIFSVPDLPSLHNIPHLFLNKIYLDYNPLVLDCLEEQIFQRTKDDYNGQSQFDVAPYRNLSFVHNRVGRGVVMSTTW